MSKDLKKEYRMLADSAAPDLWARIEAGLDARNIPGVIFEDAVPARAKRFRYGAWITAAAAFLCVVAAVPVLTRGLSGGKSADMNTAPEPPVKSDAFYNTASDVYHGPALSGNAGSRDADGAADCAGDAAESVMEVNSFAATVEILDARRDGDDGTVYTVKVVHSENTDLEAESQIEVYAAYGGAAYEPAGIYRILLCGEDTGEEILYRIAE